MYKNIFIKKQNFKTKSNNSSSNFRNVKTQRLVKIESVDDVYPEQDSGYFYAYDIFKKDKVKVSVNPATVQEMKAKGKVKSEKSEYSQWLIDEDFKNKVKKTIKTEQEDCYFLLTGVAVNGKNEIIDGETVKNISVGWMVAKPAEKVALNKFQPHLITATAYNAEVDRNIRNYQFWDLETGAISYNDDEEEMKRLMDEKNRWIDLQMEYDNVAQLREKDLDASYLYPIDRGMQLRVLGLEKKERMVDGEKQEYYQPVIKGLSPLYNCSLFMRNKITPEEAVGDAEKEELAKKTNPEWVEYLFEMILSEYGFHAYSSYTQLPKSEWNLNEENGEEIVLPKDVFVELTFHDSARPANTKDMDNHVHQINEEGYNIQLAPMAKKLTKLEPEDPPSSYISGGQSSVFGIVEFSTDVKNKSGKIIGERNDVSHVSLYGAKRHVQERIKTSLAGKVIDGLVVADYPRLDSSLYTEEDKDRMNGVVSKEVVEEKEEAFSEPFDESFANDNIF